MIMAETENFLTEGVQVKKYKIPYWAIIAAAGGMVAYMLLSRKSESTDGSGTFGTVGGGGGGGDGGTVTPGTTDSSDDGTDNGTTTPVDTSAQDILLLQLSNPLRPALSYLSEPAPLPDDVGETAPEWEIITSSPYAAYVGSVSAAPFIATSSGGNAPIDATLSAWGPLGAQIKRIGGGSPLLKNLLFSYLQSPERKRTGTFVRSEFEGTEWWNFLQLRGFTQPGTPGSQLTPSIMPDLSKL